MRAVSGFSPPRRRARGGFYANKLLHISIHCVVLHRYCRCADTSQCYYYLHVRRTDAECSELITGRIFENASFECNGCRQCCCRNRWTVICILYYGGGCSGGKCWPGYYRDDVQEHSLSGCKFFKQVKTLSSFKV
jgi:hypothetical protein